MDPRIERFVTELNDIHEAEYGDFMRKANQQIIILRNEFHHYHFADFDKKVDEIQDYVQFTPTWMIESTRDHAIRDAKRLNSILNSHFNPLR